MAGARPGARGHAGRAGDPRAARRRHRPARSWRIDTGIKDSIVRNLRERGATARAAPVHDDRRGAAGHAPRRRLPRQRARRPRGARLRGRHRARAGRQGARVGHLPRPPAAVPGGGPGDLQAAVRPPRRQPPGQGPGDREDRDHQPEPRLRGARPGRREDDRRRRGGALGDRLRRRRALAAEPLRPHGRGAGAARRARARPSSTTPRRARARTTRCTCSTASWGCAGIAVAGAVSLLPALRCDCAMPRHDIQRSS